MIVSERDARGPEEHEKTLVDVATLEQLLGEAETRLYREELGIVRQRETIAALRRNGRDSTEAWARLRRLESSQARHMADRNRLFFDRAVCARSDGQAFGGFRTLLSLDRTTRPLILPQPAHPGAA